MGRGRESKGWGVIDDWEKYFWAIIIVGFLGCGYSVYHTIKNAECPDLEQRESKGG